MFHSMPNLPRPFRQTTLTLIGAVLCGSFVCQASYAQMEQWRVCLESPGGGLCFTLEIEDVQRSDSLKATIVNGSEKIAIPKASRSADGEIVLDIEHYDSTLTLSPVDNSNSKATSLRGTWKKRRGLKKWVQMQCTATLVEKTEAKSTQPTNSKFDGRWKVKFDSSADPAVGIFATDKKSGQLHGTFLTTTGDYRYLSGSASQQTMRLSCFDGAHAFLFSAKLQTDGTLVGDFWSSDTWHETWTAVPDRDAQLADSFSATKPTEKSINALSFPNLDGNNIRLDDMQLAAPVRIVHIFGSWCPNCHDAGKYLAELKERYGEQISVVGIAFELTGEFERDANQVRKYLSRHKLDHTVLLGGTSDKALASKAMNIIDEVRSYPTTILANSSGEIVAVHQGFSGPATGAEYQKQCQRFTKTVDEILAKSQPK